MLDVVFKDDVRLYVKLVLFVFCCIYINVFFIKWKFRYIYIYNFGWLLKNRFIMINDDL